MARGHPDPGRRRRRHLRRGLGAGDRRSDARGTGRFNFTLGAISTAVGIGAALSQGIAGSIAHHLGSHAGFLFLAAVAAAALGILFFFMPETRMPETSAVASPHGSSTSRAGK